MNWRSIVQGTLIGLAVLSVTGCRHKQTVAPLPVPPPAQVPLAPAPEPTSTPQVPQVPVAPTPVPAKHVPKAKKTKKKIDTAQATSVASSAAPTPSVPPPSQVAAATPSPDISVIGNLSAGGNAAPAEKQRAADLIAEVERRVSELPASTREASRVGLAKVKDFLTKAKDALRTGDADGAVTLSTKAKLLLDDLLKQ